MDSNLQDEIKRDVEDEENSVIERRASCELNLKTNDVVGIETESELSTKDNVEAEETVKSESCDLVTENDTEVTETDEKETEPVQQATEVVVEDAPENVTEPTREGVEVSDNNQAEVAEEIKEVEQEPPLKTVEETNTVEQGTDATEPESYLQEISDAVDVNEVTQEEAVSEKVHGEDVEEDVLVETIPTDVPVAQETIVNEPVAETPETISVNGMPVLAKEIESESGVELELSANTDPESELILENFDHPESIEIISAEAAQDEEEDQTVERSIPPHMLGHNLETSTAEDPVRNGKVRKPRLGVKIPYRNLTSQIVSKQEIADEIMERSRIRNASAEVPEGGDLFFAKKLTKRLANKISSPSKSSDSVKKSSSSSSGSLNVHKKSSEGSRKITQTAKPAADTSKEANIGPSKKIIDTSSKITDNSDLIAILEGDDDTDWTLAHPTKSKRTPEWERETALKQLRELPKQGKIPTKVTASSIPLKTPLEKVKSSPPTVKVEEEPLLALDDNSEPRFAIGSVTKTYTRKRNSSGDMRFLAASILQSQKKTSSDKDISIGSSSHSPPKQTEKSSSSSKTTSKSSIPKPSVSSTPKHTELHPPMPSLKKEPPVKQSIPKTEKRSPPLPKLIPHVGKSPVIAQPQVILAKAIVPLDNPVKTPDPIVSAQLSPNTYISKSSRIVKRKKIWDPDEDVTPKYFKSPPLKSPKPAEAVEKSPEKKIEKTVKVETPQPKPAVLKPSNDKTPLLKKPLLKKVMKRKKPKRLTEIDRLLMDEGAVNLLYSVKNTEEIQNVRKKKSKGVISRDRAQRELLNKTNEIKNDLQINSTKDSPISLRKKESGGAKISPMKEVAATILQRKKSTGSTHSPPASPAFYNQHAEASRIIRRHSSSSFSSENLDEDESSEKESKPRAEPQRKKVRTHSERHSVSIIVDKQLLSEEMAKNFNTPLPADDADPKFSEFETFSVRTFKNFVQIIMSPSLNGQTLLSIDALMELRAILHLLKKDDQCRAVLFSSSGSAFCQGLDYTELVCENKAERWNIAENYAACVRDFLISISKFPKLLVAGVHGNTVGLGVTMLPLFDMVLASDTATFSTPYATLGCAAEGGVLLTLPHVMHSTLASELFFASRNLSAGEASRLGLVTRTLWPDKFQEELISALKTVSGQSLQSMQAIKKQLRQHLLTKIESSIKEESLVLVQHWTSRECQQNFVNYKVESK